MNDAAAPGSGADCRCDVGVVCLLEAVVHAIRRSAFSEHVPYDGEIGAEDAAEGLEDGVCAEGDVVPGEICATATEDDGESDGGYDAGPILRFC